MKGRIGKYKDKIVVWGDPNLTAKNEINIDSLGGEAGQSSIPVEYYKVVAPEGEDLNECRDFVYSFFIDVLSSVSTYSILVKGTSQSSNANLYTGFPLIKTMSLSSNNSHAYAVTPLGVPIKEIDSEGKSMEFPIFNNIFEIFGLAYPDNASFLKTHLVPITAEEFYNLDDMK